MRLSVVATALCLCIFGFSAADDVYASIRKPTSIPAEGLGPALQTLAKDRNFQIVFVSEELGGVRTQGAVGEFTPDEALEKLLTGTGLTYKYLDEKTVTIVSRGSSQAADSAWSDQSQTPSDRGSEAGSSKEGKKSSSQDFRVDQLDHGTSSSSSTVEKKNERTSDQLDEVVVMGRYKFLSVDTSGATNLPLPIEKVPQSISLVSNDFIEAADLKTLGEIAEYTPGAIDVGNQGSLGSGLKLRGFSPYFAIDGINGIGGTYEHDYAIFDRLEIVKGPTSVVYGVSSPGGVVNFVTKSATPQSIDYVYAQAGSWNNFRVEGQVAGALDSEGHVRAIGVVVRDQGDSFIHFMNHAKTTLYGGINFDLTDSVTGYLHGGYERFERTPTDGIPTEADGSSAPLPRSFFIGLEDAKFTSAVYHLEGDLNWRATDMLEFSLKGNYERADTAGNYTYAYGLAGNGDIGLTAEKITEYNIGNYGIGLSSIYHFDALGLKNSFVSLSALYQNSQFSVNYLFAATPGTSNIFAGETAINQAFESMLAGPLLPSSLITRVPTLAVSAQSVLQLTDPLSLLLGISYSKPGATVVTNGVTQDFSIGSQISSRAGLMYEVLPRTTAYVSVSQSFYPQAFLTVDHTPLPPVTGEQYEGGLKYRSADGRLLLTGAVFQINEKNLGQFDQTVNGFDSYKATGEVAHKGLELQALGQITRQWQINAGYAYLDPKITKDSNTAIVGHTELFLQKQTASVYSTYTLEAGFARGLSFGGGARYVSAQRTSYDGSTKDFPGYTLVDATLGYTVDKWLVHLNAHNIFDKHYFINTYQTLFYGNTAGDPANVALSIRRQF